MLEAAEAASLEAPARVAAGERRAPGSARPSFLRLLAKRLERDGWIVFEASGADLMAGQQWFGQLEGRIQRAIEELAVSKKVIWYVPDILQIALSGTHQGQAASILDQILPAITAGRLVVWTEASPASTARLMRLRPALAQRCSRWSGWSRCRRRRRASWRWRCCRRGRTAAELPIDPACVDTALDVRAPVPERRPACRGRCSISSS